MLSIHSEREPLSFSSLPRLYRISRDRKKDEGQELKLKKSLKE